MDEKISIQGDEYSVIRDDLGEIVSLKSFNKETKIWVVIHFSKEENNDIEVKIMSSLTQNWLEREHNISISLDEVKKIIREKLK
ncbi:hypothetical protein O9H85_08300 [Paenibacillus filicis]|uniref:Uncharacterized protein n=1 Tax=Paenibacillus gyeongsangnamensis TaxID=3388067 RepID=A0ABT4Q6D6_9BACL|nr:hypothetical protein [Paenibacillus filicis]MCZ8512434.1 hypothetical protein [Paenibacillus filicis]